MKRQEGYINVPGGKVWYEITGEKKAIPLLLVHGGPGYPHDKLQPLKDLSDERELIFYDQLGCGNSEKPEDKSLWTVERFSAELEAVIKTLGLKKYHILGHSWGAGLAAEFALTQPEGLVSLILSDPYLSTPLWEKDAKRLLKQLPQDMQEALLQEDTATEEYKKASKEFYDRFVYRMKELPTAILKSEYKMNKDIYNFMWGPEEFNAVGSLKDFDLSQRLSGITVPVLLLCGRFDEATPESLEHIKSLIPNAESHIFENSAHFPFWNEKEKYLETVRKFLRGVEKEL